MATALAAQLAQIRAKSSNPLDLKAQKKAHAKSPLFDHRNAANQDFDTIFQICHEGFLDLCQLDARFTPFAKSLFSEQSKQEDRAQMTKAQNDQLDGIVEDFLGLVGSRLLLKPALKAVEWLVRRFRIHEQNTVPFVVTFLPYHTHPIFSTVLDILPKNIPSTLKFLFPYIQSRENPPRHAVVHTATHNHAFFAVLNAYVLKVCRLGFHYATLLSFWASVATEATAEMIDLARSGRQEAQRQNHEDAMMRLLPVLNDALSVNGVRDLRIGCYMIVTVLASKTALNDDVIATLMDAVTSNWEGTTHAGLICLAVLTQRRETAKLPRRTFNAVTAIESLEDDLQILKSQYEVDRLALGVTLGIIDKLRKKPGENLVRRLRAILVADMMDHPSLRVAIQAMQWGFESPKRNHGFDILLSLSNIILCLSSMENVGPIVREVIVGSKEAPKSLQEQLKNLDTDHELTVQDQDMVDVTNSQPAESFDELMEQLKRRELSHSSFLIEKSSHDHSVLVPAFVAAIGSPKKLEKFLDLPILRRSLTMKEPLFISFFVRVWVGPFSVSTRAAAIDVVTKQFEDEDLVSDVQILLPYIIYGLTDPSVQIRRSSSKMVLTLAQAYRRAAEAPEGRPRLLPFGSTYIYGEGKESADLSWLSLNESLRLLEDFLVPNLEECLLDSNHIVKYFGDVMNGTLHTSTSSNGQNGSKSSWRRPFFVFLCKHATRTPLLRVQSRILEMLNQVPKVSGVSRTRELLPLLTAYTLESESIFSERCSKERVDPGQLARSLVGMIAPTDKDGIHALESLVAYEQSLKHPILCAAALERIITIWPLIKHELQCSLAQHLLESALMAVSAEKVVLQEFDAIDVLRRVELSLPILSGMLKQLSLSNSGNIDGAPPAKRRKTGHGHEAERMNTEDTAISLRRFTIVLELVDLNGPERYPELLKDHFDILENLEAYQLLSGIKLGYLEVITLNNACQIVDKLQRTTGSRMDSAGVKADVLIGCIRTTENPQVQQAALLLVASIAKVAPKLILHSVMPIFTFMGTGLMRNNDDYSAHVLKKTMDSVIPPLMESLHKRKGSAVIGASELLLSFVAAYKDIPTQRREELFMSLADRIGPDEFLFALILLLVDKYPGRVKVLDFAAGLVAQQKVITQLNTVEQFLDTILDSLQPKPIISAHLLNNPNVKSIDDKLSNVLPLLIVILKARGLKGESQECLSRGAEWASSIRFLFARILQRVLLLREKISKGSKVESLSEDVLHAYLGLLSLEGFIEALPELLEQTQPQLHTQALQSLENRLRSSNSQQPSARNACLAFLNDLARIATETEDVRLQRAAVVCTDLIVEKYGKKDISAVSSTAAKIVSPRCLGVVDNSVRVAALLCLATMMEVLGEAMIPIIPQAMQSALDHLKASLDEEAEDQRLHNACYAFVTSLLLYVPWMMAGTPLDRLLKVSYESANAEMGNICNVTRIETLRLIAKTLEPKDCFATLDRTWTNAMVEGPLAAKEHIEILKLSVESRSKSVIAKKSDTLANIFLKILDLRRIQFSPKTDDSYEDDEVEEVETAANETLIVMIYKINDTVFRPIFTRFLEWSTSLQFKKDKQSKTSRQITIWTFFLKFFTSLKSIVTNYAGLIIEDAVDILSHISIEDVEIRLLWQRVILTLQSAFEHDQDDFFQSPTHFPPLCTILLAQIPTISTSIHSSSLLPHLTNTITLLATTTDASAQHKLLCSPLLHYMRDDRAAVRLAAVKTQLALTERLGEEWLAQLPEMLPFVGEGMEDEDEVVEMEVRRWVKKIEEVLGESIAPMLQ